MDKLPLILWSGGLDSTHLVWDHLSNGRSVETVYISLGNNKEQAKRELAARDKLKKLFKEYKDASIRKDIRWNVPIIRGNVANNIDYTQAFLWFHVLNLLFDKERHSHIELGYVRGDDFWHIASDVKRLHTDSRAIFSAESPVELKFPLEWRRKEELVSEYNANNYGKKLLKNVTWCEEAKVTSKCVCGSCTAMRKIL